MFVWNVFRVKPFVARPPIMCMPLFFKIFKVLNFCFQTRVFFKYPCFPLADEQIKSSPLKLLGTYLWDMLENDKSSSPKLVALTSGICWQMTAFSVVFSIAFKMLLLQQVHIKMFNFNYASHCVFCLSWHYQLSLCHKLYVHICRKISLVLEPFWSFSLMINWEDI